MMSSLLKSRHTPLKTQHSDSAKSKKKALGAHPVDHHLEGAVGPAHVSSSSALLMMVASNPDTQRAASRS